MTLDKQVVFRWSDYDVNTVETREIYCMLRYLILSSFLFMTSLQSEVIVPKVSDFSIDTLAVDLYDPMEMDIAKDGKVFIAELKGDIKLFDPSLNETKVIAHFDVVFKDKHRKTWDKESGVMGLALAPDFEESRWVYITYSQAEDDDYVLNHRVSRFKFDGEKLDRASEQVILKIPARRDNNRLHEGGSLDFDKDGNLYISVGDNQLRDIYLYAARTASNSAVLNGKILRIHPEEDGSYTIPEGNLFKPGTPKTQPEIYVMGCRNPFRIHVDQTNGHLYWGENGPPDHFSGLAKIDKGILPEGYDEFNVAKGPGYHGWPFVVGNNQGFPSYNAKTKEVGPLYDGDSIINDLPMNHGLTKLPKVVSPMVWYSHKPSPDFPSVGQGSNSAIAGPVFHWREGLAKDAFPKYFDNCWFIADWSRSWVKMVRLGEGPTKLEEFLGDIVYSKPINLKFSHEGYLYILLYGTKGGWESTDGSLIRIRHDKKGENGLISVVDESIKGLDKNHPGTKLIIKNNCYACHKTKETTIGPSYQAVADRYVCDQDTIKELSKKITGGSAGTWGNTYAMPGHAYLKKKELKQILDVIFTLKKE